MSELLIGTADELLATQPGQASASCTALRDRRCSRSVKEKVQLSNDYVALAVRKDGMPPVEAILRGWAAV